MTKPLASAFAAGWSRYDGISYGTKAGQYDCQSFMEALLRDVGISRDWTGCNAMWRDREAFPWQGTPEECKKVFGCVPAGAWLFIWADDGGEIARGYKDGLGNASHVGVVTGSGQGAAHASASRGKVCESAFAGKTIRNGGWNRVALCSLLDYGDQIENLLQQILTASTGSSSNAEDKEGITVSVKTATVTTTGGVLNLRAKASTSGALLGTIPNGTVLTVVEETSSSWWKVQYNGKTGYVSTAYLTAEDNVTITLTNAVASALRIALEEAGV